MSCRAARCSRSCRSMRSGRLDAVYLDDIPGAIEFRLSINQFIFDIDCGEPGPHTLRLNIAHDVPRDVIAPELAVSFPRNRWEGDSNRWHKLRSLRDPGRSCL